MGASKEKVRKMFDDISPRYDFLNHFLSFGIDRRWRRKVVAVLSDRPPRLILDVASGTADLAIAMAALKPDTINGIDLSAGMLEAGKRKAERAGLGNLIALQTGDAEHIPFPDATFDAVTVAFGVRNFENLARGLNEMYRVLKPGGRVVVLEFSHPSSFPMKQLYGFYSRFVIPAAGRLISGSRDAYTYLPESVAAFPSGKDFLAILSGTGLTGCRQIPLTLGIASVYVGEK